MPFLCYLNLTAGGGSLGELVQVSVELGFRTRVAELALLLPRFALIYFQFCSLFATSSDAASLRLDRFHWQLSASKLKHQTRMGNAERSTAFYAALWDGKLFHFLHLLNRFALWAATGCKLHSEQDWFNSILKIQLPADRFGLLLSHGIAGW